jgi:hypothetical protein
VVSLTQYFEIIDDRPKKFTAKQVGYKPAPEGSAMRCAACIHFFVRAIDHFSVCEIFRSEETDANGVKPHWRCAFYTLDGDVHPLIEAPDEKEKEEEQKSV